MVEMLMKYCMQLAWTHVRGEFKHAVSSRDPLVARSTSGLAGASSGRGDSFLLALERRQPIDA